MPIAPSGFCERLPYQTLPSVRATNRNDASHCLPIGKINCQDQTVDLAHCLEPGFAVVTPHVFCDCHRTGKHSGGAGEIKSSVGASPNALGLIPVEVRFPVYAIRVVRQGGCS